MSTAVSSGARARLHALALMPDGQRQRIFIVVERPFQAHVSGTVLQRLQHLVLKYLHLALLVLVGLPVNVSVGAKQILCIFRIVAKDFKLNRAPPFGIRAPPRRAGRVLTRFKFPQSKPPGELRGDCNRRLNPLEAMQLILAYQLNPIVNHSVNEAGHISWLLHLQL